MKIEDLPLSSRTRNALVSDHIGPKSVEELAEMTEAQLLRTPNLGRKGLNEIKEALAPLDLWIKTHIDFLPEWLASLDLSDLKKQRLSRYTLEEVLKGPKARLKGHNLGDKTLSDLHAALVKAGHKPAWGNSINIPQGRRLQAERLLERAQRLEGEAAMLRRRAAQLQALDESGEP